jgi:hypothetical protein
MRVVSETSVTARRIDDGAVPDAFGDQRLRVFGVPREHQHAIVVRAAIGDASQRIDKRDVVACIGLRLAG